MLLSKQFPLLDPMTIDDKKAIEVFTFIRDLNNFNDKYEDAEPETKNSKKRNMIAVSDW